ncbi:unnamed protein product, partial [Rotaria socialis]
MIFVYILHEISWPIECQLENITIDKYCSWNTAYFILSHSPHLQTLVLNDFRIDTFDDDVATESYNKQYDHLTSLSLCIERTITMDDIESVLTVLPRLAHLRLSYMNMADNIHSLFDGDRWENFIQTNLPLLKQFDIDLSYYFSSGHISNAMQSLIESFRTPFWLEIKHWIIQYDFVHQPTNYYREWTHHLYSIPIFADEFDCGLEKRNIYSIRNMPKNNEPIIVDVQKLILDLNQIMTDNKQEQ